MTYGLVVGSKELFHVMSPDCLLNMILSPQVAYTIYPRTTDVGYGYGNLFCEYSLYIMFIQQTEKLCGKQRVISMFS